MARTERPAHRTEVCSLHLATPRVHSMSDREGPYLSHELAERSDALVRSERFFERTQVDFLRPCRTRLAMNLPISFRDRVNVEETILPTFLDQGRRTVAQAFAIDAAVDHNMGYMDAEWPIFAGHALRNHAQASFGRRKMRKSRFAANARRSAGENDAAAPERHEPARCFAPDQEAAEAADAPEILDCSEVSSRKSMR